MDAFTKSEGGMSIVGGMPETKTDTEIEQDVGQKVGWDGDKPIYTVE